eukprot:SAG31_NODE_945_length_10834_cov_16.777084_6_plen_230_part_00
MIVHTSRYHRRGSFIGTSVGVLNLILRPRDTSDIRIGPSTNHKSQIRRWPYIADISQTLMDMYVFCLHSLGLRFWPSFAPNGLFWLTKTRPALWLWRQCPVRCPELQNRHTHSPTISDSSGVPGFAMRGDNAGLTAGKGGGTVASAAAAVAAAGASAVRRLAAKRCDVPDNTQIWDTSSPMIFNTPGVPVLQFGTTQGHRRRWQAAQRADAAADDHCAGDVHIALSTFQ